MNYGLEFWDGFVWGMVAAILTLAAFAFLWEPIATRIEAWRIGRLCKRTFIIDGTKRGGPDRP